jgi:WD40 repeat protein
VRIWDAASGKQLHGLGQGSRVHAVAWSPDGSTLASGGRTLKLWDADKGKRPATVDDPRSFVLVLDWSPDGRVLAAAGPDGYVRFWNGELREPLFEIHGFGQAWARAWSPDGNVLAFSDERSHRIGFVDLPTGQTLFSPATADLEVHDLAWSPDGKTVASADDDNNVRLWRAESGELWQTLEGHTQPVRRVGWSTDGKRLASASNDKTVRLWDVATGQSLRVLEGHTGVALVIAFSPDGELFASGSGDKTARIWRPSDGQLLHTLEGHRVGVRTVSWSPDGRWLATGALPYENGDATVRIWDAESGELARTHDTAQGVLDLGWSPDGTLLAAGTPVGRQPASNCVAFSETMLWPGLLTGTRRRPKVSTKQETLFGSSSWRPSVGGSDRVRRPCHNRFVYINQGNAPGYGEHGLRPIRPQRGGNNTAQGKRSRRGDGAPPWVTENEPIATLNGLYKAVTKQNRPVSQHDQAPLTGRSLKPAAHGPRAADRRPLYCNVADRRVNGRTAPCHFGTASRQGA